MATKPRSRHHLSAPLARIKLAGWSAVDKRTVAARDLVGWKDQLTADLGGDVTAAQRALIESAAATRALIGACDAWLLSQKSIINKRARKFVPLVLQRQQLADGLTRTLCALGLERRAKLVAASFATPWKETRGSSIQAADSEAARDSEVDGEAKDHPSR